jgi:VanZ family protein
MVLGYVSHRNVKLSNQKGYYVSILLPFLDELLQTTIDGRAGRMLDVGIDLLGYLAGVSLALTLKPYDAQ